LFSCQEKSPPSSKRGSLTRRISILRKSLEGGGHRNEFISTIPKRGYRSPRGWKITQYRSDFAIALGTLKISYETEVIGNFFRAVASNHCRS